MASILKRGDSYSVRYKYKDHSGKPCEGWESFKTRKEAQERKITVEKELLDGTFLVPDTMTVEEMLYKWIPIQSTKHKWSLKVSSFYAKESKLCKPCAEKPLIRANVQTVCRKCAAAFLHKERTSNLTI